MLILMLTVFQTLDSTVPRPTTLVSPYPDALTPDTTDSASLEVEGHHDKEIKVGRWNYLFG